MYANDICCFREVFNGKDYAFVKFDVNVIHFWAESHDLRLNTITTKLMLITRKKKLPALSIYIQKTQSSV